MANLCLRALLFLLLFPFAVEASDQNKVLLKEVVSSLENQFKIDSGSSSTIFDFQVNLVQESEVASLGQTQRATGKAIFRFLPPSDKERVSPLFRWEYKQPDEQLIVSDGRIIWFYLPENQQAIKSDARKALSEEKGANPLIFLTNLGDLSTFFEIRWAEENLQQQGSYLLELIPLEKTPLIKTILLGIDQNTIPRDKQKAVFPIRSILLTNINNDRTYIEFLDAKTNQSPADGIFHFSPPEGTDIMTPEDIQQAF